MVEKPMGDEELREMVRRGGERVRDDEVLGRWKSERWERGRERESEKEGKMIWTSVGEEIMT